MFVSDKLIYIDLHKTACSHIRKMLSNTVGGELVGKHNRVANIDRSKYIIGSIRNPWDWYISLWAYGCKRQGAIYGRATKKIDMDCYRSGLRREMSTRFIPWLAVAKTVITDITKPTATWKELYSDPNNPQNFREWLRLMYNKERKHDLGEGYGFSPISKFAGLYTYRYLKLYSDTIRNFYKNTPDLSSYEAIAEFDRAHNLLDATIRNENLEEDLIKAIKEAGYNLNADKIQFIMDGKLNKTNTSKHHDRSYYLDEESIHLIANHERLLIEKYGYTYQT